MLDPPAILDAWSKAYLGWADVRVVPPVTANYTVTSIVVQDPKTQVISQSSRYYF